MLARFRTSTLTFTRAASPWWKQVCGDGLSKRAPYSQVGYRYPLHRVATTPVRVQHLQPDHQEASAGSPPAKIFPLLVIASAAGAILSQQNESKRLPSRWSSLTGLSPVSFCEGDSDYKEGCATPFDLRNVGVKEADVDALVRSLLNDPSVNISMLPDALEAQLYKSTILLTLNAVYSILGSLQGTRFLSHELSLTIVRDQVAMQNLTKALADGTAKSVNDKVLHQVAVRVLANRAVNSPWVPDALEQQIYFACLQVMFRVTQIILSTFKVRICGHDLTLQLAFGGGLENAALSAANSTKPSHRITPVDLDLLTVIAHQAGVDDETNIDHWWRSMFTRSDFVRQLHVSLYGLVLGILDDLFLGQLKVQILSDTIRFDLVPAKIPYSMDQSMAISDDSKEFGSLSSSVAQDLSGVSFVAASFVAGVGVGLTLMAFLSSSNR